MSETPLVSFVVMSYNFERFLGPCVASILAQEGEHRFEVIVVDDASTDGTPALLDSFDDPRIRVIRHERNLGHIATANHGFAAAQGSIIARIDGDDRYQPWFLNETLAVLQAHPAVGCVYGDVALIDEHGQVIEEPWSGIGTQQTYGGVDWKGDSHLWLLEQNVIAAPTVIARREAWADALPIPAGLAFSDWYLNLGLTRRHLCYYRARVLAQYRHHPANLHRNFPNDRQLERTVIRVLDQVFAADDRRAEKQRIRGRIYSLAYRNLAGRYRSWRRPYDAWRCYGQAIRHRPIELFNLRLLRSLGGLLLRPRPL